MAQHKDYKSLIIKFTKTCQDDQIVWKYYEYDSYDIRGQWFMVFKGDRMVGMYRLEDIVCVEYR